MVTSIHSSSVNRQEVAAETNKTQNTGRVDHTAVKSSAHEPGKPTLSTDQFIESEGLQLLKALITDEETKSPPLQAERINALREKYESNSLDIVSADKDTAAKALDNLASKMANIELKIGSAARTLTSLTSDVVTPPEPNDSKVTLVRVKNSPETSKS